MKSVVFCGSIRLVDEMEKWAASLRAKGVKVYIPRREEGVGMWNDLTDVQKREKWRGFVKAHNRAIRDHDVVFIFNTEGRIGQNTTREIGYATALGKPVYAVQPDVELGLDVLFEAYCGDAGELAGLLNTPMA